MRLKVPNGIVNSDQMRFYADSVEKYGEKIGVVDITTRANIQLRGIKLEDAPDVIDGLHARNQTSFQSATAASPQTNLGTQEQRLQRKARNNNVIHHMIKAIKSQRQSKQQLQVKL